jgi:hypothetical protein
MPLVWTASCCKLLLPFILLVLTQLFNFILTSSIFPVFWKISNVVPIPKVNSLTEKSNYRPISILPVLAKAFENVMFVQIAEYVTRIILFRHFSLTMTALVRVFDDIRLNLELNQPTILVLLDFSIAYAMDC